MKSTKAMTGWRLGFGLFPKELVEPARNLAINSWTCDFAGENPGKMLGKCWKMLENHGKMLGNHGKMLENPWENGD